VGARADARFDESRRVHRDFYRFPARCDLHAARGEGRAAVAGALRKGRKADAEVSALRACGLLSGTERGHIDRLGRHLQCLAIAAFVEHEPRCRCVRKSVDQVAPPDFDRADVERGGRLVHQPFEREGDDRPRHAAIGRHRASVCGDTARMARIGAHIVRSGQFRHCHQRLDATRCRKARIRANVGDDVSG
jgi:hypothetical protein